MAVRDEDKVATTVWAARGWYIVSMVCRAISLIRDPLPQAPTVCPGILTWLIGTRFP